ncbi:response regulator [Paraburkholderia sp. J12]|uniref:response regulator n=1 Tax=Paraburkholderia sp. J12 TaxID=2805432 RepID=UPI002ABE772A|nr:response regulator [Paraburkholderia sp. J12]
MFADTHILLVDDNPDELRLLIEALRGARFRISVAMDGMQAYQRALAGKPDLVVMDIRMPRMDGFTACRLLAANSDTREIPVIFLSSLSDLDKRLEGLGAGAVDYVIKPFEPAEVVARIQVHLRRARPVRTDVEVELGGTSDGPLVQAAIDYLLSHLHDPPTLDDLAKLLGTNEKRLSRAFRKNIGKSPFEYLRERRLKLAARLLAETSLAINAISDETGFTSAANFATVFREHFGQTPSEYRRANCKESVKALPDDSESR